MTRQIAAACPNCGWRDDGHATDGSALKVATEHNALCREQRPKLRAERPVREWA